MPNMEPIAVIGSGCRFPGSSDSPSKLWKLLNSPRDLSSKVPADRFNVDAFHHPVGTHHGTTNATQSYFLKEDIKRFDASFFNISASEAACIDPQQRVLLETVYESVEAAGQRLSDLQGSSTGVFCGVMCDDYGNIIYRDLDSMPRYTATGTSRAIISNRISYFFDWHGPSLTLDTACSSSLVAVHLAAKALRDGDCRMAVAAGTNLILAPSMYISESKLSMLSPTGRSRMWDSKADGYSRGEGVAAVTLKKLSDAIADGDNIECVIRGVNANQDGRSMGITMPSSVAQTSLIRSTYQKAGLDIENNPFDKCQYFEAHGTGTPAGDPQEASAIYEAFFSGDKANLPSDILHVGSIKTIIGHTEGTAGLAGLLKASLAVQKGIIPPNLHFDELNPKLKPYCSRLRVPTGARPWPDLPPGVPRRASINSFGFGGTNAHAIIENYTPRSSSKANPSTPTVLPFTFSAISEKSLGAVLESFQTYLQETTEVDLINLAWSLLCRRSAFAYRLTINASSVESLLDKINEELELRRTNNPSTITVRPNSREKRILGIFTGQGAQWPQMGLDLIKASPDALGWFEELQQSLDSLPTEYQPQYSLLDELSKSKTESRLHEAAISQPMCTAVQVVLVNFLRSLGINFSGVIGHSSGEIGAAYASGVVTAAEAIRIAHLRGHVAKLAGSNGLKGAMLAASLSMEEALELCSEPQFTGRITMAASNSPSGVTLSGDADAVAEVESYLKGEEKFARALKVDTAYHSHHMYPCSEPYMQALKACEIDPKAPSAVTWYSSVHHGKEITSEHLSSLKGDYWKENMVGSVLFSHALTAAVSTQSFDLAIELGPHPALKGPALQTISSIMPADFDLPYTGLLNRSMPGNESIAAAIGRFWAHVGLENTNVQQFVRNFDKAREFKLVRDLPKYPFDHSQSYWSESRVSKDFAYRGSAPNQLLGSLTVDTAEGEWRWRNYLKPEEIEWLDGHQIQSQMVFPAMGYVAMAFEAINILASDKTARLIEVSDMVIDHAIALTDDPAGVETLFKLEDVIRTKGGVSAKFSCHSNSAGSLKHCSSGRVSMTFGVQDTTALPTRFFQPNGMTDVDIDGLYSYLNRLGYGYTGPFRGIESLERKRNAASGLISNTFYHDTQSPLLMHPALMDTALQSLLAAIGDPRDGELYTLHVPTKIGRITVNPAFCGKRAKVMGEQLVFDAAITEAGPKGSGGDADLYTKNGVGIIQIEGVEVSPLMAPLPSDDRLLFRKLAWGPYEPDVAATYVEPTQEWFQHVEYQERISLVYIREIMDQITEKDRSGFDWHRNRLVSWFEHVLSTTRAGNHPILRKEWLSDTHSSLATTYQEMRPNVDTEMVHTVGKSYLRFLRGQSTMLEETRNTGILDRVNADSSEIKTYNQQLGKVAGQIGFRFPRMKILELGAGLGNATQAVLDNIEHEYHSYTFTDTSEVLFEAAQEKFEDHAERMVFKTLDIEGDLTEQAFDESSFDLVIASNTLYATQSLEKAMTNIRRLLKPGGRVLAMEGTDTDIIRSSFKWGGFEGWWLGEKDGRTWSPMMKPAQWDSLLMRAGFSGIESISPDSEVTHRTFSVILAQATDETLQFLKSPLMSANPPPQNSDLYIIGGATEDTAQLAADLRMIMEPYFQRVVSTPDVETLDLEDATMITTVSLADMDGPFFRDSKKEAHDTFKTMVEKSKHMLWATVGSESEKPYIGMGRGIMRCLAYENPQSRYQHLNVIDPSFLNAQMLSETLLRLVHPNAQNDYKLSSYVWSTELDLKLTSEGMKIARLHEETEANKRYMAHRRTINDPVSSSNSAFQVEHDEGSYSLVARGKQMADTADRVSIKVLYSTLNALKTADAGFLHLVMGVDAETNAEVIALTEQHASFVSTPPAWVLPCEIPSNDIAAFLAATASALAAESLMQSIKPNTAILLHEVDNAFRFAISTRAAAHSVKPHFTTSKSGKRFNGSILLHEQSPSRQLRGVLPKNVSATLRLGNENATVFKRVESLLSSEVTRYNNESICRSSAYLDRSLDIQSVTSTLTVAYQLALRSMVRNRSANVTDVSQLPGMSVSSELSQIIDWSKASEVAVKVRTASAELSLSANKTYLLIGMTGDLGRSVCEWMVQRGARSIVVTSRNPKVPKWWLDEMAEQGARVVPMAMDVTSKYSILDVDGAIRRDLPPLGGVVNGAMVLADGFFSQMEHEAFQNMLKPKCDGSDHLNELYSDDTLDFFILFGSATAPMGNRGQTAYSAANTYMANIIQGRRERGLVGSIMNPAEIRGVGYVARQADALAQVMVDALGYLPVSERDVHEMFAEAILSGRPDSGRTHDAIVGIAPATPEDQPGIIWFNEPRCWNITNYFIGASSSGASGEIASVKEQLEAACSLDEVIPIIEEAFIAKVRSKLQIADEDPITVDESPVELGADSLVAVDLRTWFAKELSVDMPVLKILGGTTIHELAEDASGNIPAELLPNLGGEPQAKPEEEKKEEPKPKSEISTPKPKEVKPAPKPEKETKTTHDAKEERAPVAPASSPVMEAVQQKQPARKRSVTLIAPEPEKIAEKAIEKLTSPIVEESTQPFVDPPTRDSSRSPSSGVASTVSHTPRSSMDGISDASSATSDLFDDVDFDKQAEKPNYQKVQPLSYAQSRYYFLNRFIEDSSAFNVTIFLELSATPSVPDLESAVEAVGQRHETLRTCYLEEAGDHKEPCQAILPQSKFHLEQVSVADEEEAKAEFSKLQNHVYDLENGDVARINLITSASGTTYLAVGYHHMCLDGFSSHVLFDELEKAYSMRALPPVSRQYTDYSATQQSAYENGGMAKELKYWKEEFDTLPEPMPLMPTSSTRSRQVQKKYEMGEYQHFVEAPTMSKIKAACKKARATPFHFFLAVFRVFLARLADTDDFCIGIADANRLDPANQNTIGFLLNLLPLRFRSTTGEHTFNDILKNSREKAYTALRNSKLPFDKMLDELSVPRSTAYTPLFQVLIDWHSQTDSSHKFGNDIYSKSQELVAGHTGYDMTLLINENANGGATVNFRFQNSLYSGEGAELMIRSYLNLVEQYASNVESKVSEPSLWSKLDLEKATEIGKGPSLTTEWPDTVSKRIDNMTKSHPSKIAVQDTNGKTYTYSELSDRINLIAGALRTLGVQSDSSVCVFQHPSAEWVPGMLATWKMNAAYVPLDLRNPTKRLATMVQDCKPQVILCHDETEINVKELNHPDAWVLNVSKLKAPSDIKEVPNTSTPASRAVVLYTSGTTGRPKGFQIGHDSLKYWTEGYTKKMGLGAETVMQQCAMTFDGHLDQILTGLVNGGRVVVVPRNMRGDPVSLAKLMVDEQITYTKATPSEYTNWLRYGSQSLRRASRWQFAFGGGEHFTTKLAAEFRNLELPDLRVFNSYGPGEVTITCHKAEIDYKSEKSVENNIHSAGFSLPNYTTYIVDKNLNPVPQGVSGEILIGGTGPCMGYLNNEALTSEKFLDNAFASPEYKQNGWTKVFRTFDRGHLLKDGSLKIEGRMDGDTMVKIRGLRMELEDIENTIVEASDGALTKAVVTMRGEEDKYLVAHAMFDAKFDGNKDSFLQNLITSLPLPQYMCPSVGVAVDELPYTVHGKLDRKTITAWLLPKNERNSGAINVDLSESEVMILNIWEQVLGERLIDASNIGPETSFFFVGGNSVLLVKLQAVLQETLGVALPLMDLLGSSTIAAMASKVRSAKPELTIDWENETSIEDIIRTAKPADKERKLEDLNIVLSGATGFLGKRILKLLVENPAVSNIHAVAVRNPDAQRSLDIASSKITIHYGDLATPRFGLETSEFESIADEADIIVHCGANRSFWDAYPVIRGSNVHGTKTAIEMASYRRTPIHFLSSGSVTSIADDETPPTDGSDAYVASKWASERLLQNAAAALNIPVVLHRPMQGEFVSGPTHELLTELRSMMETLQSVPIEAGWSGTFTLMPGHEAAAGVVDKIMDGSGTGADPEMPQVVPHQATVVLSTSSVTRATHFASENAEKYKDFERVPAPRWLGKAKKAGLEWFVAAQNAVVNAPDGEVARSSKR